MKTAFFFFINPVVNVPPPINFAGHLASQGYKVILFGYHTANLKRVERLSNGARIFRFNLKSRGFFIRPLAQFMALFEFILICRLIMRRGKADIVVTFNDPASIILRYCNNAKKKVAWLLEYPERKYSGKIIYNLLMFSSNYWKYANALIFPTRERHALGIQTKPSLLMKRTFIVHNAPRLANDELTEPIHGNVSLGIEFFKTGRQYGDVNIIYSGAVGNRYGVDELISAVGSLKGFRLLIVGKKHDLSTKEVSDAVQKVKYNENVLFIDQIPYSQLCLLFEFSDVGHVYYQPDTLNTLFSAPGKLYEYLKGGLVILTDNNSCIKPDLENFKCGAFYIPGDVGNLKYTLKNLGNNNNALNEMKRQSFLLFETKYNHEKETEPLLKFLSK